MRSAALLIAIFFALVGYSPAPAAALPEEGDRFCTFAGPNGDGLYICKFWEEDEFGNQEVVQTQGPHTYSALLVSCTAWCLQASGECTVELDD